MIPKVSRCKHCKSTTVIKYGKRRTSRGEVQIYKCKSCGKFFSETTTYEKAVFMRRVVQYSFRLRQNGLSFREIKLLIEEAFGIEVSHVTIYNWVRKKCTQEH